MTRCEHVGFAFTNVIKTIKGSLTGMRLKPVAIVAGVEIILAKQFHGHFSTKNMKILSPFSTIQPFMVKETSRAFQIASQALSRTNHRLDEPNKDDSQS